MRHRDRPRRLTLVLFAVLLGLLAPVAGAQVLLPVAPIDPDFTNVSDILSGRRFLMRVDDLLVVNLTNPDGGVKFPDVYFAHTLKSQVHEVAAVGARSAISNPNPAFGSTVSRVDEIAPQALGRMYDFPRDVVVSLLLAEDGLWHVFVDDPGDTANPGGTVKGTIVPTLLSPLAGGRSAQAVVLADVDGDGYAEAVIAYLGQDAQGQVVEAVRIAKAVDLKDVKQGVRFGPEMLVSSAGGLFVAPLSTLRTGDLDGDGFPEVLGFNGTTLSVATVDRVALALTVAKTVPLANGERVFPFNMMAGRFRTSSSCTMCDDVVVVGQRDGDTENRLTRYAFSGDGNLNIQQATRAVSGKSDPIVHVFLSKGPLRNWFTGQDLLVVGTAVRQKAFVEILESDASLDFKLVSVTPVTQGSRSGGYGCLYGLAVGNFDDREPNGGHRFGSQVATLWRSIVDANNYVCSDPDLGDLQLNLGPLGIRLWSIKPSTKPAPGRPNPDWLSIVSETQPLTPLGKVSSIASLRVGDLQGRSLVLGAPERVTIVGHVQPDMIIGIPPMHIDWINPAIPLDPQQFPGCNKPPAPCMLNISLLPSVPPSQGTGFGTQYTTTTDSSVTSERKSTTSWSVGVKVTTDNKISFGSDETDDQESVQIKTTAGYTHDGTVGTTYNSFSGKADSITLTTGAVDHLFFTSRRQNIYYYRVIGHTNCDGGPIECLDTTKRQPRYVSFYGPDQVLHQDLDGSNLEWYQPVHEPGNIFSYPWSLEQLQQAFASSGSAAALTPLTDFSWLGIDTSGETYKTTWTNSGGRTKTSGSTDAENSSVSVSVSGSAKYVVAGVSTDDSFEVNQSTSVATHNSTTQSVSESLGIQVNKPELPSVVSDTYLYQFGGYVLGMNNPVPTPQTNVPFTDANGKAVHVDVKTTGPMLVAFLADPLLPPALPWWANVYNRPDVALNHPERWNWSKTTMKASFNAMDRDAPPQDQAFFKMKGLFITPKGAGGAGPTRTIATAGDQMVLTVRVHNFSLVDTNDPSLPQPAARVRVRFHGQKWNSQTKELDGPAFLIGDTEIASIPGFNSDSNQGTLSNWALASVPFDTTPYANTFLMFWVVVWMEDAQNRLVEEVPFHGLTHIPPRTVAQITDVPVQAYSNNVGLYGVGMPFQVVPPKAANAAPAQEGRLAVSDVSTPDQDLVVDRKARITATIRAIGGERDGVPVAFYDGDPLLGGKLFYFQVIPHLDADKPHVMRAFYRPPICGVHQVVVVAGHPSAGAATAGATVTVIGDPATGENCPRAITALGPVRAWVGVKNSDDVGTSFDLKAEAHVLGKLVGSGQINGVNGGGSGFNNAKLASIPLSLFNAFEASGTKLSVTLSARITCSGRGHASGAARLWFNDAQATSRVGVTVDGATKDFYLKSGSTLAATLGSGPKATLDLALDSRTSCADRPFAPFGTWSITLP